jgi:peroxiredoxin
MSLNIGDTAPSFVLKDSAMQDVDLTSFSGKNVVLLFFPFAFTGVCTTELCQMRDDMAKFNNMNAEILAISVDSPFTLAKFKEENKLEFPLLSDFNKEVSKAYHALYEEFVAGMKGVSKRAAFVVDKTGTIKYVEVLENAGNLPNFEAIETALAGLN